MSWSDSPSNFQRLDNPLAKRMSFFWRTSRILTTLAFKAFHSKNGTDPARKQPYPMAYRLPHVLPMNFELRFQRLRNATKRNAQKRRNTQKRTSKVANLSSWIKWSPCAKINQPMSKCWKCLPKINLAKKKEFLGITHISTYRLKDNAS